jgi:AraC-like DNA-binding protein/quercetin dioxygenase-like cupin family protein
MRQFGAQKRQGIMAMHMPEPVTRSGDPVPSPSNGHVDGVHSGGFGPKDYPLAVVWIQNHTDLRLHTHDYVELALVLDGTARHVLLDGGFEVAAGSVVVVQRGIPHGYAGAHGLELISVLFDPRRLQLSFQDLSSLSGFRALFNPDPCSHAAQRLQSLLFLAPPLRREMTELAGQLAAELRTREAGYKAMSGALLVRMIVRLLRAHRHLNVPQPPTPLGISRAITFIENHLEQPLRIEDLAAQAGTCARSLQRHFLRSFGASPVSYVNRLRVEKASELLLKTDMNITEVAGAVGIDDSNYFSRLFHRLAGTSPSDYRQYWRRVPCPVHPLDDITQCGCVKSGLGDLARNKKHLKGFGRSLSSADVRVQA